MADASILPTYLLSKFTRGHVTVALVEMEATSYLQGTLPIWLTDWRCNMNATWGFCTRQSISLEIYYPYPMIILASTSRWKNFFLVSVIRTGIRNSVWLGSFVFSDNEKVLSPEVLAQFSQDQLVEDICFYEKESSYDDPITKLQYLDLKLYLQESILVKVDRASMAVRSKWGSFLTTS